MPLKGQEWIQTGKCLIGRKQAYAQSYLFWGILGCLLSDRMGLRVALQDFADV
jgi:hypothetical protein